MPGFIERKNFAMSLPKLPVCKKATLIGTGPVLPVHNISASINYYQSKLGFACDFGEDQHPGHGSVTRCSVGIQFTQAPDGYLPSSYPGWFYVFVEDIDALYAEYEGREVKITRPLESHAHGM